jgi:hypothetical protein
VRVAWPSIAAVSWGSAQLEVGPALAAPARTIAGVGAEVASVVPFALAAVTTTSSSASSSALVRT